MQACLNQLAIMWAEHLRVISTLLSINHDLLREILQICKKFIGSLNEEWWLENEGENVMRANWWGTVCRAQLWLMVAGIWGKGEKMYTETPATKLEYKAARGSDRENATELQRFDQVKIKGWSEKECDWKGGQPDSQWAKNDEMGRVGGRKSLENKREWADTTE